MFAFGLRHQLKYSFAHSLHFILCFPKTNKAHLWNFICFLVDFCYNFNPFEQTLFQDFRNFAYFNTDGFEILESDILLVVECFLNFRFGLIFQTLVNWLSSIMIKRGYFLFWHFRLLYLFLVSSQIRTF